MTPSANRCSILLCTQLLLLAVQNSELDTGSCTHLFFLWIERETYSGHVAKHEVN